MQRVYLDYNASCPIRPEVIDLVTKIMHHPANASAVHWYGREAHKWISDARDQVAAMVGVGPKQIIFNCGATEANNTVFHAFRDKPVWISAIEHSSVLQCAPDAKKIPVTRDGVIDLEAFEKMLSAEETPALVSIVLVNSETGVIQPIKELTKIAKAKGVAVHTDAVQASGRIPLNFNDLGVDYMSLSAHKIGGPQGVGALAVREGIAVPKYMKGGTQETHQRGGTYNTAGIAGFGLAAQLAVKHMDEYDRITKLRDRMESDMRQASNEAVIFGADAPRVGNTTDVALPGIPAETQLMTLDLEGIAVSSGSACSSGSFKASHVLEAMGASQDECKSALRISLGYATTEADIDRLLEVWTKIAQRTK